MGLWSTELSRTLSTVKHKDTDELLADIKTYERIQRGRVERSANSRSTTSWQTKGNRDPDKHSNKTSVLATTATPTTGKRSKEVNVKYSGTSTLQCWNCKLSGHTQRDCPSPRRDKPKCATCHWSGGRHHKTCTETPQTTSESALYATEKPPCTDNNYNGDNPDQILHEKLATINHTIKLKCLVDSGSSVCLMKESIARQHELKRKEDDSSIMGFGANAITGVIGKMTVTAQVDEAVLDDIVVYVVPDCSLPREFLLGRPWCESPEIAFIKYNKALKFYNTTAFPFSEINTITDGDTGDKLVSCVNT